MSVDEERDKKMAKYWLIGQKLSKTKLMKEKVKTGEEEETGEEELVEEEQSSS